MRRGELRLLAIGCGLALAVVLACVAIGAGEGVLFIAPALMLALPLLSGRYLGAERLVRISRSRCATRRRPAPSPARRWFLLTLPRGGLLIASSLAVRPPPQARQVH
jgi:hypothetical protein